jgi:hypothetical protein
MVGRLAEHVGHDDPDRVTEADVVGFKDVLLQGGKSGKTIFNHLAAVRARTCAWSMVALRPW